MKREMLTVGYVARLFNVKKTTVKMWSRQFAEYLSKSANPDKSSMRFLDVGRLFTAVNMTIQRSLGKFR